MTKSKNRIEVEKASAYVKQQHEKCKDNPYRERYHYEAPSGWCNDPNGFSFCKGKYHLFYQHMPYDNTPGDYVMGWGHAVSTDLIHWEDLPEALTPVDDYDSSGCWSGCALEIDDKMILMYTGLDSRINDKQMQCMAVSEDGIYFEKVENNPILPGALCDDDDANFRDPCIWKHEDTWYMIIGSSKGKFGRVLLYKSTDLKSWTYVNNLVDSLGELGTVCECPNFFELDGKYILFISPHGMHQRKSLYLVGDFDYKTGKFFWHNYGEIDWGMDFYAPQVLTDNKGRKLMIGWMNSWDWMPWSDGKYFTSDLGWCGSMSLPRELSLGKDSRLISKPIAALEELRKDKKEVSNTTLKDGSELILDAEDPMHSELKLSFDLSSSTVEKIILEIYANDANNIEIIFDIKKGELIFDRTRTLYHIKSVRKCNLLSVTSDKLEAHIFIDSASVEIFTDSYMTSMSNTIYLPQDSIQLRLKSLGGQSCLTKAEIWNISSIG